MEKYKNLFIVILFLISVKSFAYLPEEGNITASVGPYFFQTYFKDENPPGINSPLMPGLGLIVNGDISDHGSLEIAIFHLNKRYLRREADKYISEVSQIIHVTMGYKWWLGRYLATSLALYSAYPMGNTRIIYSDFPAGGEIPTSARDITEYGFDLALQSQIWKGTKFDVVAELRYSLSLTSRSHEEADHFGGFIGLKYLLQEKNPNKKPEKKKFD